MFSPKSHKSQIKTQFLEKTQDFGYIKLCYAHFSRLFSSFPSTTIYTFRLVPIPRTIKIIFITSNDDLYIFHVGGKMLDIQNVSYFPYFHMPSKPYHTKALRSFVTIGFRGFIERGGLKNA